MTLTGRHGPISSPYPECDPAEHSRRQHPWRTARPSRPQSPAPAPSLPRCKSSISCQEQPRFFLCAQLLLDTPFVVQRHCLPSRSLGAAFIQHEPHSVGNRASFRGPVECHPGGAAKTHVTALRPPDAGNLEGQEQRCGPGADLQVAAMLFWWGGRKGSWEGAGDGSCKCPSSGVEISHLRFVQSPFSLVCFGVFFFAESLLCMSRG